NIPVHAKEKKGSSDSKTPSPAFSKASNTSDSEDVTPLHSPKNETNSRRSSASSMSSMGSISTHESLSPLLLEQLARAQTILTYILIFFHLYHTYMLPSIRHHFTTLYISLCSALDDCAANDTDADTDFAVLALEKEMELLVDWAVPGMGNAIELARKRWGEEDRGGGMRGESR